MGNASSPPEIHVSLMSTRTQPGAGSEGIDNFQLPKALVTRIAKSALPPEAKLQKDTINTFVNVTTVFINYLAATAQDVAASCSRKTIAGPDILEALEIIEFGDLVPSLQSELEVYRSMGKADKSKGTATGADVKGKGKAKEPSLASTAAHTKVTLPADHDPELEPPTTGNIEEQEEGDVEDVGLAVTGPQEEEEEEEAEEAEQEDGVVDEDVGITEAQQEEEEEEEEEEVEEDIAEEVEDDAADEAEEIVDTFAIEEEELDGDARGLEESAPQNEE